MDTKRLDEITEALKTWSTHHMYDELTEQARRAIRVRAYFLRQPKEVWRHYVAALEYKGE